MSDSLKCLVTRLPLAGGAGRGFSASPADDGGRDGWSRQHQKALSGLITALGCVTSANFCTWLCYKYDGGRDGWSGGVVGAEARAAPPK